MALVVGLKVLNECDYIRAQLNQWYSQADFIRVIEGCDRYMRNSMDPERVTRTGLSGDGTTKIIEKFKDPQKKIEHIKLGFYDEEEEAFEAMTPGMKAGDILWMAAGDTFYFTKDIKECKRILEHTDCLTLRFKYLTYWHDFHHVIRGGGWDNELAVAFKLVEDDMQVVGKGVTMRDRTGRTYNDDFYAGTTVMPPNMFLHHFSYVRSVQKILEKQVWQLEIEERFSEATEDSPIHSGVASGGLDCWTIREKFRTPQNYIARNFPWFTNEMDERQNIRVEKYDGPIPEPLRRHAYKNLVWDEEPVLVEGYTK
jgi:hypothetical protein